jgi:Carboxypeptidase regulatory-like domain
MKIRFKFFLTIVFFAIVFISNAQVTTASISGLIRDNEGPLAKATVKAYYQKTGVQYDVNTSKKGNFRLNNLNPGGPYIIEVSYAGYETQKIENYFLKLGADENLDFHLKPIQPQLSENGVAPVYNEVAIRQPVSKAATN